MLFKRHVAYLIVSCAIGASLAGQSVDTPDWQTAAGGKMSFEVASVKPTAGPFTPPSFPLESSDAFTPTGGRFIADFPLAAFIAFAYKIDLTPDQRQAMLAHLPEWVSTDRFIIEAKGPSNATKDQFRLMMQSLLADRFHLQTHFESRDVLVYALTLAKTGKLGPALQPHSTGPACPDTADLDSPPVVAAKKAGVFPPICGNYGFERTSGGHVRWGSRKTTMAALASMLPHVPFLRSLPTVDRPVVDRTGLTGTFDFTVEYAIPLRDGDPGAQPNDPGPGFLDAVREQLGLLLKSDRASIRTLVIDRIERPSAN